MHESCEGAVMARRGLGRRTMGTGALGAALLCLALGGCALGPDGAADAVGAATSDLNSEPGEALPRAAWLSAEAGCEGLLDTTEQLQVMLAEGEPELRVVLVDGVVLCVDSASAVAEELEGNTGEGGGPADHLGKLARTAQHGTLTYRTGLVSGDPSPQPSTPQTTAAAPDTAATRPNAGDPSPQPSDRTRPNAGDPSPQPSQQLRDTLDY